MTDPLDDLMIRKSGHFVQAHRICRKVCKDDLAFSFAQLASNCHALRHNKGVLETAKHVPDL